MTGSQGEPGRPGPAGVTGPVGLKGEVKGHDGIRLKDHTTVYKSLKLNKTNFYTNKNVQNKLQVT